MVLCQISFKNILGGVSTPSGGQYLCYSSKYIQSRLTAGNNLSPYLYHSHVRTYGGGNQGGNLEAQTLRKNVDVDYGTLYTYGLILCLLDIKAERPPILSSLLPPKNNFPLTRKFYIRQNRVIPINCATKNKIRHDGRHSGFFSHKIVLK